MCLPPLLPDNYDAARVYLLTRGQLILSMSGVVDINQLAVHEAMKLYRIENRKECFEKVLRVAAHFIAEMREQNE